MRALTDEERLVLRSSPEDDWTDAWHLVPVAERLAAQGLVALVQQPGYLVSHTLPRGVRALRIDNALRAAYSPV